MGPLPVSTARITATRTGCQPRPPSGSGHLGPTYPAARLPTPHRPTRLAERLPHLTSASTRIPPPATGDLSPLTTPPRHPTLNGPHRGLTRTTRTTHATSSGRAHALTPPTRARQPVTGPAPSDLWPTNLSQAGYTPCPPRPTRPPGQRPLLTPDPDSLLPSEPNLPSATGPGQTQPPTSRSAQATSGAVTNRGSSWRGT